MMLDWYELSHIYTPKCKELVKKAKGARLKKDWNSTTSIYSDN